MDNFLTVPKENRVVGLREVLRLIAKGRIKYALIAKDADAHILSELKAVCAKNGVGLRTAQDKKRMGELLGLDVPCAVCGELKQ